jgi:hemin uptake protein HemP
MVKRHSQLYHLAVPQQSVITAPSTGDFDSSRSILSVTSEALFAGADELEITHQGAQYRLRQTALGKLILTK